MFNATEFAAQFCNEEKTLTTRNHFVRCGCSVARVGVLMYRTPYTKEIRTGGIVGVPGSATFETRKYFKLEIAPVEENEAFRLFTADRCLSCRGYFKVAAIGQKIKPEHKCNARCTNAKSGDCECACGGHNHGKKWG